ncbi:hypothetical protein ACLQ3K_17165 [Tsukamurella sp. DT100]|uniref:hypothetical protein n=1 Tax=Tsukamurella sp. DT100 TaxID=3393415 RepID=UPI003CF95691
MALELVEEFDLRYLNDCPDARAIRHAWSSAFDVPYLRPRALFGRSTPSAVSHALIMALNVTSLYIEWRVGGNVATLFVTPNKNVEALQAI